MPRISQHEFQDALEWGDAFCVDCGERSLLPTERVCQACGGQTLTAERIKHIMELVEEPDEERMEVKGGR